LTQRHAPHELARESPGGGDGLVSPGAGSDSRPFFLIVTGVFKVGGHGRSEKSRDKIDVGVQACRQTALTGGAGNELSILWVKSPSMAVKRGISIRKVVTKPSTVS
jgi:hypothetical protein